MQQPTQEKIKSIIEQVVGNEADYSKISEDTNLLEVLGIDSLLVLQIIVLIEKEFDIYINDDTTGFEMLSSLKHAVQAINTLQMQKEQDIAIE